jgi:hypothetical protein
MSSGPKGYIPDEIPDKNVDRLAWEVAWAGFLARTYDPALPRHSILANARLRGFFMSPTLARLEDPLHNQTLTSSICELQSDLFETVVDKSVNDDFEKKWLALHLDRRKELILEGLCRACFSAEMESERRWCPEMRVDSLAEGEGFITLLRCLLPDTLKLPLREPVLLEHPDVEAQLATTAEEFDVPRIRTYVQNVRLRRAYFIALAMWNIILAYVR